MRKHRAFLGIACLAPSGLLAADGGAMARGAIEFKASMFSPASNALNKEFFFLRKLRDDADLEKKGLSARPYFTKLRARSRKMLSNSKKVVIQGGYT